MNTPTTYQQSAAEQTRAAAIGFAAEITRKGEELLTIANANAENTIRAANLTREMGLELESWIGKEQMRFEQFEGFFREHTTELPAWLDANAGRKLIAAHKAHPGEITDLRTAVNVLNQMTFFAVGLLEEPQRTLPQTASGKGFWEKFKTLCGKQREEMRKLEAQLPQSQWSRPMWETVRIETMDAAKLHEKAKEVLKK